MAEKLSSRSPEEQSRNHEVDRDTLELSRKNIDRIRQLAEQEKSASEKSIEALKEKIETASSKSETISVETQENKKLPDFDQGDLKRSSFNKTMSKVQSRLPGPQRAFSKIIHNKTVETISEVSGKTLARPSGVLGGGLVVLLGSTFVLYIAKHYGFQYNYNLFIALYLGGFAIGILFEVIVRLTRKNRTN